MSEQQGEEAFVDDDPEVRLGEARAAKAEARRQLKEVLANGDEVTQITSSLRFMRERNRYGERMALAMTPRSPQ